MLRLALLYVQFVKCWQSLDKNDEGSRQTSGPWYGGWWMVIFGKNFGQSKRGVAALIGGRPCLQTIWIGSQMILCMVPRGPGGEADLKVVANGRVMNLPGAVAFELPKVTAIQPSNSPTFGGIFVTLSGARHTSHVTRHTPHVTRHSSHVTRLQVSTLGFLTLRPTWALRHPVVKSRTGSVTHRCCARFSLVLEATWRSASLRLMHLRICNQNPLSFCNQHSV